MRLRADVHCYHCGQVSGTWEWQSSTTPEHGLFQELGAEGRQAVGTLVSMRCLRCRGRRNPLRQMADFFRRYRIQ